MSSRASVDVFVLAENRLLREALLRVFAKKNEIQALCLPSPGAQNSGSVAGNSN